MKKYIIFILVIISLVISSCGKTETQVVNNTSENTPQINDDKNIPTPQEEKKDTSEENVVTEGKINTTMREIYQKGKPATCTYKMINGGNTFDSILYVEWKKLRYTMNTELHGMKMENSTIVKDGYTYSWSSMAKDWWKMKLDPEDVKGGTPDSTEKAPEKKEMTQKIEFDCKYSVDSSKFDLPADINFKDMGDIPHAPESK